MWLGVDYYPEQWEDSLLDQDLDTICELGCNVIRIGEFAWHRMERSEGAYDFSYFDRVVEKAREKGLAVIMGTPTAAIPSWLAIRRSFQNRKTDRGGFLAGDMSIVLTIRIYMNIQRRLSGLRRNISRERKGSWPGRSTMSLGMRAATSAGVPGAIRHFRNS
jgi:hypothetical protein